MSAWVATEKKHPFAWLRVARTASSGNARQHGTNIEDVAHIQLKLTRSDSAVNVFAFTGLIDLARRVGYDSYAIACGTT